MLTTEQLNYAAYVIGKVESDWNWGCVNQLGDAITIGMWQWYAYNACELMELCRDASVDAGWGTLSERLRAAVAEHPSTDTDFWTSFFMQQADISSWNAASKLQGNRDTQAAYFATYAARGITQLGKWGLDVSGTNAKVVILYLTAWWQSPASAQRVLASVGGQSVTTVHNAIKANPVLSNYKNRYNTAVRLLEEWDGKSDPPDYGYSGDITIEPDDWQQEQGNLQSTISYVEVVGNDLVIHGKMSSTESLLCHNNGNGVWLPVQGTNAQNPSDGSPGTDQDLPTEFPTEDWNAMKQLWLDNLGKWNYSNGAGRLNPPQSGYSDCSGCIYWAANAATNNKYSWIGSGGSAYMVKNMLHVYEVPENDKRLPIEMMQPGDVVYMYQTGGGYVGGHVEWYFGDNKLYGAGSAPLPHLTTSNAETHYVGRTNLTKMVVLRFLTS